MPEMNITALIETFASQITVAVEASVAQRLQAAIAGAFGAPQKRGPGRPPRQFAATAPAARATAASAAPAAHVAEKKKRPKQLCPVPGCKNLAAPVFGMVCKDHKNVAKSKIKKYRAERKAAPSSAAKLSANKTVRKATPKAARARKLQGQYMGSLKSLTGADRERVKQTAKDKGVAEAVKLALSLKKSRS